MKMSRAAKAVARVLARSSSLANNKTMIVTELLQQHYATGLPEEHLELLNRLSQYCGKSFFIHAIPTVEAVNVLGQNTSATTLVYEEDVDDVDDDDDVEESAYQWTFYNALLFVIITISTIGEIFNVHFCNT